FPLPHCARRAAPRRRHRPPDRSRARNAALAGDNARGNRAAPGACRQRRRHRRPRRRRAGQSPAPQDRARSRQSAACPDRRRHRLPVGDSAMTTLDLGKAALRSGVTVVRSHFALMREHLAIVREHLAVLNPAIERITELNERASATLKSVMPKGLYARALLIIIVPMVVLQSVVAFMFMERHYNLVTQRLSAGVVRDIATLIEIYKAYPKDSDHALLRRVAQEKLGLVVDFLPVGDLPPPGPKPFFSL